jgi:cellulose synthase/poly-beta-1,6-N-acetylglucosamine synthase-like glycosyltransferase
MTETFTIGFAWSALSLVMTLAWLIVAAWALNIILTFYGLARQRPLPPTSNMSQTAESAPFVSILVPARNEAHRVLSHSIRSILSQDYGCFEVIVVNDRSTDDTGKILETLARTDSRLRVVEGGEPPAGWLGKPYAMQQALAQARGRWVLATDADMIFDKSALRTGMDYALAHDVDALTFIPHFESKSFWERLMIPAWSWVFLIYILAYRVSSPGSQGAVGIGGFFLIRRAALESVGGYQGLKNEVMEDVRLAERLKHAGARVRFKFAPRLVSTRMYTNFKEMWECSTKNWFSGMKFSFGLALAAVLSMYAIAVVPPIVAIVCAIGAAWDAALWRLFVPAFAAWMMQSVVIASVNRRCGVPVLYSLLAPLGLGIHYAMLFDSAVRITTGRGVTWKGRKVYERTGVRPPQLNARSSPTCDIDE